MEIFLSIRAKADSSTREVKFGIGDGLVVGRGAEQGVLLDGPDLSREHLVITAQDANLFVADLSSNGTWVNGKKLQRSVKVRVQEGDLIEVPGYALSFKLANQPSERPVDEIEKVPPPLAEVRPFPLASPDKKPGLLDPAYRFVGSFTFLEKSVFFIGIAGLGLLLTYTMS